MNLLFLSQAPGLSGNVGTVTQRIQQPVLRLGLSPQVINPPALDEHEPSELQIVATYSTNQAQVEVRGNPGDTQTQDHEGRAQGQPVLPERTTRQTAQMPTSSSKDFGRSLRNRKLAGDVAKRNEVMVPLKKRQVQEVGKKRKFKCQQCPATYENNYNLEQHRKVHSLKTPLLTCAKCGVMLGSAHALTAHRGRVHAYLKR